VKELHLLEVDLGWPPEDYLRRKLDGLATAGFRVSVTAERAPRPRRQGNVVVIRLPSRLEPRAFAAFWLLRDAVVLGVRDPARLVALARGVRRAHLLRRVLPIALARPDVVHFEWKRPAIAMLPAFEALGVPVVVSNHAALTASKVGDPAADAYPDLFAAATAVHCVSEAGRRETERLGLAPGKARVVRNAVDTSLFTPAPRPRDATLRVIGVGGVDWKKGYGYALGAIARLRAAGIAVSFEILGGDPAPASGRPGDRQRVLYLIHDLGLDDAVTLRGQVSQQEVLERLRASDVLLQASISEGLPNAVLEAMACGLPVVVTDAGGVPEAVTDGVEGFVCPRYSADALADALARIASDPVLARRMGEAGRKRVCAEFALERQVEAFAGLYRGLVTARDGRSPSA